MRQSLTSRARSRLATASSRSTALLALLCAAQFMIVLDVTVVNVALPAVQADLGIASPHLHWVATAYAVAFGGFLLVGGRAADLLGHRVAFAGGAALFALASLVCALAPTGAVLISGRALQGLGAAFLSPAAFGALVRGWQGGQRTAAIGAWGSVGALGAASGLLLGGVCVDLLTWEWIFLVNLPVGLAAAGLALRLVEPGETRRGRIAATDATLATVGLTAVAYALAGATSPGLRDPGTLGAAVGGVALLALFAGRQSRSVAPLLPMRLLADRGFLTAGSVGLLHGAVMLGAFLLLPLYLQHGRGLSAIEAGLALLAVRGPAIVWARVVGYLTGRFGPYPGMALGSALMTASLVSFTRLPQEGALLPHLLPGLLAFGLAIPLMFVSVSAAAFETVRPDDAGVASGLLSTFQWTGGALGLALVSAAGSAATATAHSPAAAVDSVHAGFWACSGLAAAGLGVAALALARVRSAQPAPAEA